MEGTDTREKIHHVTTVEGFHDWKEQTHGNIYTTSRLLRGFPIRKNGTREHTHDGTTTCKVDCGSVYDRGRRSRRGGRMGDWTN